MRIKYTCQLHKIINEYLDIPDDLIAGKSEDEKQDIYKAVVCQKLKALLQSGYFIFEDEITFNTEIIPISGDEV